MKSFKIRARTLMTSVLFCFFAIFALSPHHLIEKMEIAAVIPVKFAFALGATALVVFLLFIVLFLKRSKDEDGILAIFLPVFIVFLLLSSIMYLKVGFFGDALLGFGFMAVAGFSSFGAARRYAVQNDEKLRTVVIHQITEFIVIIAPLTYIAGMNGLF